MTGKPTNLFKQGTATEVQELMSRQVVTVRSSETVRDVLNHIVSSKVSAVSQL